MFANDIFAMKGGTAINLFVQDCRHRLRFSAMGALGRRCLRSLIVSYKHSSCFQFLSASARIKA